MRRFPLFGTLLPLLLACQGAASAQAMVENALGAGRAATSAAPMKGIGNALNNLEKTLNKSLSGADSQPAAPAATSAPASAKTAPAQTAHLTAPVVTVPVIHYDDPKLIEKGMAYPDLIRRFGRAALEITSAPGTVTLSYMSSEGGLQVEVVDDKVSSITRIN